MQDKENNKDKGKKNRDQNRGQISALLIKKAGQLISLKHKKRLIPKEQPNIY